MSLISPLAPDLAVVYPPLCRRDWCSCSGSAGSGSWRCRTRSSTRWAPTCSRWRRGVALAVDGNPETRRRMERAGVEVLVSSGEELSKGDGGPTCLTRPLLRAWSDRPSNRLLQASPRRRAALQAARFQPGRWERSTWKVTGWYLRSPAWGERPWLAASGDGSVVSASGRGPAPRRNSGSARSSPPCTPAERALVGADVCLAVAGRSGAQRSQDSRISRPISRDSRGMATGIGYPRCVRARPRLRVHGPRRHGRQPDGRLALRPAVYTDELPKRLDGNYLRVERRGEAGGVAAEANGSSGA